MPEPPTFLVDGHTLTLPVLSTKLFIPPSRPAFVQRPHLMERLSKAMMHALILVSAPAGSGKTTMVSAWHASAGKDIPLAWLSLDQDDNHLTQFIAYLYAALGTLKAELSELSAGLLQSPQAPPFRVLMANLINDLGSIRQPFILVLDDYHVITSAEIHEALTFLLDHIPPQMHILLITRSEPPLPLARMRARGHMFEISASDLRFTTEEAETFMRQSMGLTISQNDVALLAQRTEGWVAGLQLAALAIQNPALERDQAAEASSFLDNLSESFSGSHPYVADYLSDEVLSRQPEPLRDFLLKTSILERMTASLCDDLLDRSDSQSLLRQLDQSNLFLISLDDQRRWYRYHHLFADLLRARLQGTPVEQIQDLHRRAAAWFEQHGLISEAVKHALASGDHHAAARIIEQHAMERLMRGDSIRVLRWIDAVAPLVQDRPWLRIYQSWAWTVTGEVGRIEPALQAAEAWIAANPSQPDGHEMGYHIAAIRVLAAERNHQPQQGILLARQLLARLPDQETAIRGIVTFTLGDTYWSVGDLKGAMRAFTEASQIDRTAGIPFAGPLARSSVGLLLVEEGELHRAAETLQAAIQMASQPGEPSQPVTAAACLGLAGVEYEWNHLDTAGQYAQQALDLGARWGNPDTLANAHLMRARLHQAMGEMPAALESLRQAEELARDQGVTPWSRQRIDSFRVRQWLVQENFGAAERWVRENALDPQDEITYPNQSAYLTLARILAKQNQSDAALTLANRLQVHFEKLGQMTRILEVVIFQSLLQAHGDSPAALASLARALALGEPEGFLRVFLDEGEPIVDLLRLAASRGIAPKYAVRLLSAFNLREKPPQPLVEPLSERELQVLRLIADGHSNQAVADQLVVALGTIKTHTASLYRKLGVSSRTQAVARAKELGLL